jgi:hypothetical protein
MKLAYVKSALIRAMFVVIVIGGVATAIAAYAIRLLIDTGHSRRY